MSIDTAGKGGRAALLPRKTVVESDYRGIIRIQSWPRPMSRAQIEKRSYRHEIFRAIQRAFALLTPAEHEQWRRMAMPGPFLPRDFYTQHAYGRLWALELDGHGTIYTRAALTDVTRALDIISQTPGSILFRGNDFWTYIPPGQPGQVLASGGADQPPFWSDGGGGGGEWAPPNLADFNTVVTNPEASWHPAVRGGVTTRRGKAGNSSGVSAIAKPGDPEANRISTAIEMDWRGSDTRYTGLWFGSTITGRWGHAGLRTSNLGAIDNLVVGWGDGWENPQTAFETGAFDGIGTLCLTAHVDGDWLRLYAGSDPNSTTLQLSIQITSGTPSFDRIGMCTLSFSNLVYVTSHTFLHWSEESA